MSFYMSTNGSGWNNNAGWGSVSPVCSWFGITCSGDNVTGITLNNNNLNGPLPESIGNLATLESILLNGNRISGTIPSSVTQLQNLFLLSLGGNELSGEIPVGFGNLTRLAGIALGGNNLSGSIPTDLGNLGNFQFSLGLSDNQLTGPIPSTLANLLIDKNSFVGLYLNDNQLNGEIPSSFDSVNSGEIIDFSSNRLTGVISETFAVAAKSNNIELRLDENQFRCPYPSNLVQQFSAAGEDCIPDSMPAPEITEIQEGDQSLLIKITADDLGFFTIIGFEFRCVPSGSDTPVIVSTEVQSALFTGLTNDIRYACTATAQTEEGDSDTSSVFFATPAAPVLPLPIWLLHEATGH